MRTIIERPFNFRSKRAYLKHIEQLGRRDVHPRTVPDEAIRYGLMCWRGWEDGKDWYSHRGSLEDHIRDVLANDAADAKLSPLHPLTPAIAALVKLFQIEESEVEEAEHFIRGVHA